MWSQGFILLRVSFYGNYRVKITRRVREAGSSGLSPAVAARRWPGWSYSHKLPWVSHVACRAQVHSACSAASPSLRAWTWVRKATARIATGNLQETDVTGHGFPKTPHKTVRKSFYKEKIPLSQTGFLNSSITPILIVLNITVSYALYIM